MSARSDQRSSEENWRASAPRPETPPSFLERFAGPIAAAVFIALLLLVVWRLALH